MFIMNKIGNHRNRKNKMKQWNVFLLWNGRTKKEENKKNTKIGIKHTTRKKKK
jgi:hypothetical protein